MNSPFRFFTTGALTMKRVPAGSFITSSTICSADWEPMGRPQLGQWGLPTRA